MIIFKNFKQTRSVFWLFASLAFSNVASGQQDVEFWFAAPDVKAEYCGQSYEGPIHLNILNGPSNNTIVIDMPANVLFTPITVSNIQPNQFIVINPVVATGNLVAAPAVLTPAIYTNPGSYFEGSLNAVGGLLIPDNKGLRIRSTASSSAVFSVTYEIVSGGNLFNTNTSLEYSKEVFNLKGRFAFGTNFIVPSTAVAVNTDYQAWHSTSLGTATNSIDIVATQNGTSVSINTAGVIVEGTGGFALTGVPIILNAGQTLTVRAEQSMLPLQTGIIGQCNGFNINANKLRGTSITSNLPIAVTVSDDQVQCGSNADLLGDQLTANSNIVSGRYIIARNVGAGNNFGVPSNTTRSCDFVEISYPAGSPNFVIEAYRPDGTLNSTTSITPGLPAGNTRIDFNNTGIVATSDGAIVISPRPAPVDGQSTSLNGFAVLHYSGIGTEISAAAVPMATCGGGFTTVIAGTNSGATNNSCAVDLISRNLSGTASPITITLTNAAGGTASVLVDATLLSTNSIPTTGGMDRFASIQLFANSTLNAALTWAFGTGATMANFMTTFNQSSPIRFTGNTPFQVGVTFGTNGRGASYAYFSDVSTISSTAVVVPITCSNSGSISVTATGVTGTTQYAINGGALGANNVWPITVAGVYTITVRDGTNCTATNLITVPADNLNCCTASGNAAFEQILASQSVYSSTGVSYFLGKYFIADNAIIDVPSGQTLDLTNVDMVFGKCAGIIVRQDANIKINNSVLRGCDGNTWRGVTLLSSMDNIIDESVFKNAEYALDLEGSDARVNNNYFQDCHFGMRINGSVVNGPITGNNFVWDDNMANLVFDCDNSDGDIQNDFGIYAAGSHLNTNISHNQFFAKEDPSGTRYRGIVISNAGVNEITQNDFTNLYTSIGLNEGTNDIVRIYNNNIEQNNSGINSFSSQIQINNTNAVEVKIAGNDITGTNVDVLGYGIEAMGSSNVSITDNNIQGFASGIVGNYLSSSIIANNKIFNAYASGIYLIQAAKMGIKCNEISMNHADGSNQRDGILIDASIDIDVFTNCISDASYAINLVSTAGTSDMIDIYNNFLYNYSFAGVRNDAVSTLALGNFWAGADGRNSFVGNINQGTSFDVWTGNGFSTQVFNNYGAAVINPPNTLVYGAEQMISTASCGKHIADPKNSIYVSEYDCSMVSIPKAWGEANLKARMAKASSNASQLAGILKAAFYQQHADYTTVFNEMINQGDAQTQICLKVIDRLLQKDALGAEALANSFKSVSLNIEQLRISLLLDAYILRTGSEKGFPISLIMPFATTENAFVNNIRYPLNGLQYSNSVYVTPFVKRSDKVFGVPQMIGKDEASLFVYPNPAKDEISLLLSAAANEACYVRITDVAGKLLYQSDVQIKAGQITIDVSNYAKATYFVTLRSAKQMLTAKFVKE
jgi:Secretion system C-terminal sorting domain/Right handed beta helix region